MDLNPSPTPNISIIWNREKQLIHFVFGIFLNYLEHKSFPNHMHLFRYTTTWKETNSVNRVWNFLFDNDLLNGHSVINAIIVIESISEYK